MSTTDAYLTVRGIEVEVTYKEIKNLHIGVYPPLGHVRVAAPHRLDNEVVRLAVIQRLPWIKRNQLLLRDARRQTPRQMVTGESHYVWGVCYRLRLEERSGQANVVVDGDRLYLRAPIGSSTEARRRIYQNWQRRQLRERLEELIARWEPVIGQQVPFWNIRRMKTKWGSCNPDSGRIWFNLELATKDPRCVEYIVVHELAHLRERGHGPRFLEIMDQLVSDWRQRRDELNDAPLAQEEWRTR